jgi:DNA-binding MarR family transcriptional regulator
VPIHRFPEGFAQVPGHLIRCVQQRHNALWLETLTVQLTPPQYAVLAALRTEGPLDQGSLAEVVSLDKSTMGDVAQRLEQRGLIARVEGVDDRRRRSVMLTEVGRRTVERAAPQVAAVNERLTARLSASQHRQLLSLLARISEPDDSGEP